MRRKNCSRIAFITLVRSDRACILDLSSIRRGRCDPCLLRDDHELRHGRRTHLLHNAPTMDLDRPVGCAELRSIIPEHKARKVCFWHVMAELRRPQLRRTISCSGQPGPKSYFISGIYPRPSAVEIGLRFRWCPKSGGPLSGSLMAYHQKRYYKAVARA